MINILIEGTGSEKVFWDQLLSLVDRSKFRLISYGGIRNLVTVYSNTYNKQDLFIISADDPVDNKMIHSIVRSFRANTYSIKNVFVLNTICFEDIILKFLFLKTWLFSTESRKLNKDTKIRLLYIDEYRKYTYDWRNSKVLSNVISSTKGIPSSNLYNAELSTEKVAATILDKVTSKTNFRTDKKNFGTCFYCSCAQCNIMNRIPKSKRCGLSSTNKNSYQKAVQLYKNTIINKELTLCKRLFLTNGYTEANYLW